MEFSVITIDKLDSTQNYLIELSNKTELQEGVVINALSQFKGVGQFENKWESESGKNLTFSLLLQPRFLNPCNQFLLTQVLSLAISDFLLTQTNKIVSIKWPNDIYIGKKKICGILVKNQLLGSIFENSFCGIGLNVNQEIFPPLPNPTSLFLETGKEFELNDVLKAVLKNIDLRYNQLKGGEIETLQRDYMKRLLYKDVFASYIYIGREIEARIFDVNEFGHLLLEDREGNTICCELKEISFTHNVFLK
ncbi:MAG: biotin--[acetyl-CoA-carboxylase] ligase [Bacteroidales bacterium]|jgi:BirA family biotin operon repressor/biotin-[acetyl-CoA-carboxylase] ligase|nr:biotin--[acetyl-CoA-carboxylase] ligase [Bacteroidales bacterium]